MAFENISPGAYFRNFTVPPQPSTNVLRLLEDVTPSFFFFDRQLRYVGQSETDKSRSTLLRSCVEVSTSDNLTTFLKELGFRSLFFIIILTVLVRYLLKTFQTYCMKNLPVVSVSLLALNVHFCSINPQA